LTEATAISADLERKAVEHAQRVSTLSAKIEELQQHLPTQEDEDALAALASLLQTKKVSVPAIGSAPKSEMRIATPKVHPAVAA
jgi:hypothetical protein